MLRAFPQMTVQKQVPADADEIIGVVWLPAGSSLNNVHMSVDVIGTSIDVVKAALYGIDMYVLPVLDPDTTITPDAIWDNQVPKDDAVGSNVLDLDTAAADDDPVFEPGDPSIEKLIGMTTAPTRIFRRRRILTFAKRASGFIAGTPNTYIPAEHFATKIGKKVRVENHSIALLGFSSPKTTITDTTFLAVDTNKDWAMLQYLQETAKDMLKQLVGLTEAGAETPYEDAASFISRWMEDFVEEDTDAFIAQSWRVFADLSFDVTVPGEMSVRSMSVQ